MPRHYKFMALAVHIRLRFKSTRRSWVAVSSRPQMAIAKHPIWVRLLFAVCISRILPFIHSSPSPVCSVANHPYRWYDNESKIEPIQGTTAQNVWNLSNQGNDFLRLDAVPPTIEQSCVPSDPTKIQYINHLILTYPPTFIFTCPEDVLC